MAERHPLILAIDQGTTSTRAMLFDTDGNPQASASEPLRQIFPEPGWVEHHPEEIWQATLKVAKSVLSSSDGTQVAVLGITNQRETTVLWDRQSGKPLHNAIVWQDRRTAEFCDALRAEGLGDLIARKTGLLLDPYFSATKLFWLFEQNPNWRKRAEAGELAFGTIDSWLIFKLTGGKVHATDATNASRTMLFDIAEGRWDDRILERFNIPRACLPTVKDCRAEFGTTDESLFERQIPITGVAGDQQAATIGQACLAPGMVKATYGTGCFALVNTGASLLRSKSRMLSTILQQTNAERLYALEGSIFMAGATIQWLRDNLGIISDAAETENIAHKAPDNSGVYLVPAFQGLGAPFWDSSAKGAILGLSRASDKGDIVRAGLESVAFQTRDLIESMSADMKEAGLDAPRRLRVDGGMVRNSWLMQCLSDLLQIPVDVAAIPETTALGAAYHAMLGADLIEDETDLRRIWRAQATFEPKLSVEEADTRYEGWQEAVDRVRESD